MLLPRQLAPIELVVIAVVVVLLLVLGPRKVPEFARALGLAKKEFDQAKREIQNPTEEKKPDNKEDENS